MHQHARVLVAERNRDELRDYSQALTRGGFQVNTASTERDCLDRLRRFEPRVLVLDPHLMWSHGDDMLALIRDEDSGVPWASVLLLCEGEPWPDCEPPVVGFLTRPVAPAELLAWLYDFERQDNGYTLEAPVIDDLARRIERDLIRQASFDVPA